MDRRSGYRRYNKYRGDALDNYLFTIGLFRKVVARDETSLFRAFSDQHYYTQRYHRLVAAAVKGYISRNPDMFEDINEYDAYMKALAKLYKRDIILFRSVGGQPINVTKCGHPEKIVLCESSNNHFDVVYSRDRHNKMAIAQSILYEILYKRIFGLVHECDVAVDLLRCRAHSKVYNNGYDQSEYYNMNEMNHALQQQMQHSLNPNYVNQYLTSGSFSVDDNKEMIQWAFKIPSTSYHESYQLQLEYGPPFPYKISKALDPVLYRNIEYDVWVDSRREQFQVEFTQSKMAPFPVGTQCLVKLDDGCVHKAVVQTVPPTTDPDGQYNVFVMEPGTAKHISVSIEQLQRENGGNNVDENSPNPESGNKNDHLTTKFGNSGRFDSQSVQRDDIFQMSSSINLMPHHGVTTMPSDSPVLSCNPYHYFTIGNALSKEAKEPYDGILGTYLSASPIAFDNSDHVVSQLKYIDQQSQPVFGEEASLPQGSPCLPMQSVTMEAASNSLGGIQYYCDQQQPGMIPQSNMTSYNTGYISVTPDKNFQLDQRAWPPIMTESGHHLGSPLACYPLQQQQSNCIFGNTAVSPAQSLVLFNRPPPPPTTPIPHFASYPHSIQSYGVMPPPPHSYPFDMRGGSIDNNHHFDNTDHLLQHQQTPHLLPVTPDQLGALTSFKSKAVCLTPGRELKLADSGIDDFSVSVSCSTSNDEEKGGNNNSNKSVEGATKTLPQPIPPPSVVNRNHGAKQRAKGQHDGNNYRKNQSTKSNNTGQQQQDQPQSKISPARTRALSQPFTGSNGESGHIAATADYSPYSVYLSSMSPVLHTQQPSPPVVGNTMEQINNMTHQNTANLANGQTVVVPYYPVILTPFAGGELNSVNFAAEPAFDSGFGDLPLGDLNTLRYFYNMGCEYFKTYNTFYWNNYGSPPPAPPAVTEQGGQMPRTGGPMLPPPMYPPFVPQQPHYRSHQPPVTPPPMHHATKSAVDANGAQVI